MGLPGFEDAISVLREAVIKDARPLQIDGTDVEGLSLAVMFEMITSQLQDFNEVSLPSMSRYVIYDGFIKPRLDAIEKEGLDAMPKLKDYDRELYKKDPRTQIMNKLVKEISHISSKDLVNEAIGELQKSMDIAWEGCENVNEVFGNQTA